MSFISSIFSVHADTEEKQTVEYAHGFKGEDCVEEMCVFVDQHILDVLKMYYQISSLSFRYCPVRCIPGRLDLILTHFVIIQHSRQDAKGVLDQFAIFAIRSFLLLRSIKYRDSTICSTWYLVRAVNFCQQTNLCHPTLVFTVFKLMDGLLTNTHNFETRHLKPGLHRQLWAATQICLSYLGHRCSPSNNPHIQTRYKEVLTSPKLVMTSRAFAGVVLSEMHLVTLSPLRGRQDRAEGE